MLGYCEPISDIH